MGGSGASEHSEGCAVIASALRGESSGGDCDCLRGWLRRTAAAGGRAGVVDEKGLLVNVGILAESSDRRKVYFDSLEPQRVGAPVDL